MEFYMHLQSAIFRNIPGNHLEHLGVFTDFSKMDAIVLHANGICKCSLFDYRRYS
jgi:hypothetical protein